MVAMVMVVAMVVVVTRMRVGRDGEHRQHGGDGQDLGEGHGELLSSGFFWEKQATRRVTNARGGIMPQNRTRTPRTATFRRAGAIPRG
jgi:hypothetical protein